MEKYTQPSSTKNLIFDLGGVLYTIDLERSLKKFRALLPENRKNEWQQQEWLLASDLVQELETGRMLPHDFLVSIKERYQFEVSLSQLKEAWMGILTGIIPGRMEALKLLQKKYRLFLLSNTNPIHFERLGTECAEMFSLFEKCYYSFEMGMRKPGREIFDQVCLENQLQPSECLFMDDAQANVDGAIAAGWQARLCTENDDFMTSEINSILEKL